jgi:hypothetical protein
MRVRFLALAAMTALAFSGCEQAIDLEKERAAIIEVMVVFSV